MTVSMAEDTEGNLWAVSLGPPRRIIRIAPKVLQAVEVPQMPSSSKIASDPKGGLWLGLTNGDLVHYLKGQMQTFPSETAVWFQSRPDCR